MFGQTPAFGGGGSLFGASSTPSFGGSTFGAPASTTPSSFTFGAPTPSTGIPSFGGSTAPAFGATTTTPSLFGAPAATTTTPSFGGGGSLFGAPASGGTSLFGATSTPAASTSTTGGFPYSFSGGATTQPAASTGSAFSFGGATSTPAFGAAGTTGSAFGAAPAAGTSFGGFGAPAGGGMGGPAGTTIAAYAPVTEKDGTSNTMVHIHNISAMPQYKDKSFEELRWEDYQLGRKGAGMGSSGAVGGGGIFGSTAPAATTTTGGLFGGGGTTTGAFSAPSTGTSSLFGAPAASTGSLFGGGGATGSSLFGAPAPATGSGLFGAAPAASTGTGLFGATTSAPTTGSSLFGGSTTTFGAPSTGAATGSSLFPSFTGGTTAPASSAFSFGGTSTPATTPSTGGLFGATTTPSTSLFGGTTGGDTSSSLFGGTTSSSLFGGGATTGTGAAASSSLFGGTGSSLFGSTAPASGGGLFGTAPSSTGTTGGLFGGGTGSSLFGAPSTPAGAATGSTFSLGSFGSTGAATGSSLFGGSSAPLFSGLGGTTAFGGAGAGSALGGVVPSLVATIDSPHPYGALPPVPSLGDSDAAFASAAQTKSAYKPKHYKLTTRSPAASRPLGYYQTLGSATKRVSFMGEMTTDKKKDQALGASTPEAFTRRKLILEPDDNVSMPEVAEFTPQQQPSHERPRTTDRGMPPATPYAEPDRKAPATPQASTERERDRVLPAIQITTPSGSGLYPALSPSPKEVARAGGAGGAASPSAKTPLPAAEAPVRMGRTPKKPVVERRHGQVLDYSGDKPETKHMVADYDEFYRHVRDQDRRHNARALSPEAEADLPTLSEPGYWMEPPLDALRHYSKEELAHVENLTVGREGFGQIQFLEPVDVRGLDLNQLIVIEQHLINVFPDDATKPVRGQGINVPARITIEGAWPAKRDAKSVEEYEAFLRKKGSRRKQRFVDYDRQRGAWTFDVPGF